MKKIVVKIFLLVSLFAFLTPGNLVFAQQETASEASVNNYYKGYVKEVISQNTQDEFSYESVLSVELLDGPEKGSVKEVNFSKIGVVEEKQKIKAGDRVVLIETKSSESTEYYVTEKYRLDAVYFVVFIAVIITVLVSGKKGIASILGLIISVFILLNLLIPGLQSGQNPILIALVTSTAITLTSMYLAHGINRRTTVSILATFITVFISLILALWSVNITELFGFGSEEAFYLQATSFGKIDVQGLLLAGIIVGTLGILDDVTISQVSIVEELNDVDKSMDFWELVKRGLNVGKEHIASLINTLALAYVGVSLPLLLSISMNQKNQPFWVIANTEFITEEIVRTMVGSSTLILAVPISTVMAAVFIKYPPKFFKYLPASATSAHNHSHHK